MRKRTLPAYRGINNHMTKDPYQLVAEAKALNAQGLGRRRIAKALSEQEGRDIPHATVGNWLMGRTRRYGQ